MRFEVTQEGTTLRYPLYQVTTLIRNYNTYFLIKMVSSNNDCTQTYVNIGTILGLTPTTNFGKSRMYVVGTALSLSLSGLLN